MAALNGLFDCVQLLLDLEANVSAVTFHYGTTMDMIGAGSTPLHYAACGGNLKCCQILLARGASKMTLNCNGWLPIDIARMWSRHWLEQLLSPDSDVVIPEFPHSNYLSLPLFSILNIAREFGLQSATITDEVDICVVCLERTCTVAAEGCEHQLCVRCALYLCSSSNVPSVTVDPPGSIPCPLCRHGIVSFKRLPSSLTREMKLPMSLGLCAPCMLQTSDATDQSSPITEQQQRSSKTRAASVSSDMFCPVTCSPFPSVNIPMCACNDGTCPNFETHGTERHGHDEQGESSPSRGTTEQEKIGEGQRLGKTTTCSRMFWGRRSCSRENQCNAEINA
ncbi:hypothetical protein Bca101_024485 [Brassica carinata]